jgi:hypothetical protein
MDRIADLATLPASIRLRATCRRLHDRIDERLFAHVRLRQIQVQLSNSWAVCSPDVDGHPRLPVMPLPAPSVTQPGGPRHPVPTPAFNSVIKYTRTLDLPPKVALALPALPNGIIWRSADVHIIQSPPEAEVRYLDTRYYFEPLVVQLVRPIRPQRWTIHITFDGLWQCLSDEDLIKIWDVPEATQYDSVFITLVLHPIKDGPATDVDHFFPLDFFFPSLELLDHPTITRLTGLTVVGVEECSPELLGMGGASADEVRAKMADVCERRYPVAFVSMDEWAKTAHPHELEVPASMLEDVKWLCKEYEEAEALRAYRAYR